jgi:putative endonuclease
MSWYTYVLESSKDGQWYTGCTGNFRKRLQQHTMGQVTSTKNRTPLRLIYCEVCIEQEDAFRREKYLKTGMGKRYLKNRLKRFLSLTG